MNHCNLDQPVVFIDACKVTYPGVKHAADLALTFVCDVIETASDDPFTLS